MNKELIKDLLGSYWRELIIVVLVFLGLFLWEKYHTVSAELEFSKPNPALTDVTKRETEDYPTIDKTVKSLGDDVANLAKDRAAIIKKQPTTDQAYEDFKKEFKDASSTDVNDPELKKLSEYFKANGYSNTIRNN